MDYVDGHTLKHAILTTERLPVIRAVDMAEQSAAGVATAAECNIVHRDIKPQNLLLSIDNTVKLTDFGLARSHESKDITVTGFFVGTPFYVAPEQVENSRKADVRADLYSLACVFFELLTSHVPYDGEHAWDVVMLHLNGSIPSVRSFRPELPAEYDAFFERALAKQPDSRYQTPSQFIEALEKLPIPERYGSTVPKSEELIGALIPSGGAPLTLTASDMIIGRSDPQRGFRPDVDLLSFDPAQTVSRRHARLTRRANHFYIEDLNAFNRTRLNGTPLVPHQDVEIHSGDVMRLGHVELRFEIRPR